MNYSQWRVKHAVFCWYRAPNRVLLRLLRNLIRLDANFSNSNTFAGCVIVSVCNRRVSRIRSIRIFVVDSTRKWRFELWTNVTVQALDVKCLIPSNCSYFEAIFAFYPRFIMTTLVISSVNLTSFPHLSLFVSPSDKIWLKSAELSELKPETCVEGNYTGWLLITRQMYFWPPVSKCLVSFSYF